MPKKKNTEKPTNFTKLPLLIKETNLSASRYPQIEWFFPISSSINSIPFEVCLRRIESNYKSESRSDREGKISRSNARRILVLKACRDRNWETEEEKTRIGLDFSRLKSCGEIVLKALQFGENWGIKGEVSVPLSFSCLAEQNWHDGDLIRSDQESFDLSFFLLYWFYIVSFCFLISILSLQL